MYRSFTLAIISIFFSFLLFQCGFSIFSPGEHIGDDAGKAGEIKEWVKLANSYYQNPDDEQRSNGKKILQNLLDYRWNEMTVREKFDVAILYSTISFNIGKTSGVLAFTKDLKSLVESFSGSGLVFNDDLNMNFVNQNLSKANRVHQEVQPILNRLLAYSNDINEGEQATVYIHVGGALVISYADMSVNLLGNLTNNLVPLKTAYTNLLKKVQEVQDYAMTLPITQAQYDTSTNELCTRELPEVEAEEAKFGTKFTDFNTFLEGTMIPEVNILSTFKAVKTSFLASVTSKIDEFSGHFNDFSKGKEKVKQVQTGCQAGQFDF